MKVTLHNNEAGNLMVYVPKKDLEEAVVNQSHTDDTHFLTLANGWELSVKGLGETFKVPKTVQAKRLDLVG